MRTPSCYEVRRGRLFVNGEPVPVRRRVVEAVLTRMPRAVDGPIPDSIARRILALERTVSISELAAVLGRIAPRTYALPRVRRPALPA